MPPHQNADLLWNRGALTPFPAGIIDDKWPLFSARRPIQQSKSSVNLRWRESPGDIARIAALPAPTAIIGCPHMTLHRAARETVASLIS
jgi:hypothetical protein